jgi:hypothetical protein
MEGKARFAAAAGTGERDQAHGGVEKQVSQLERLVVPADEGC